MELPASTQSVVVSYHPAHAMHGFPMMMPGIETAIRRVRELAESDGRPPRPKLDLLLDPTPGDVRAYLDSAPLSHHVATDVETPHDNPTKIDLIGLSNKPWSAVVFAPNPEFLDILNGVLCDPTRVKVGHNIPYDIRAYRKNGCDVVWPMADTIQREALIYPPYKEAKRRRWLSLSTAVQRRIMIPYWKDVDSPQPAAQKAARALYRAWFPNLPEWLFPRMYNALDVMLTWLIYPQQRIELEQMGMHRLYAEVVAPAALELTIMEDDGILMDEPALGRWKLRTVTEISTLSAKVAENAVIAHAMRIERLTTAVDELDRVIAEREAEAPQDPTGQTQVPVTCKYHPKYTGLTKRQKCKWCAAVFEAADDKRKKLTIFKGRRTKARGRLARIGEKFQPSNDNHWRALLFTPKEHGGQGLTPTRLTGKMGLEGVDEDDITELQQIYPECELLTWRVELQHLYHRLGWIEGLEVGEDGRVHFTYSMHRAVNGQISSGLDQEEPDKPRVSGGGNALNVREEDRHVFLADPGCYWVEQDFSQIELWIMAWLARDMELLTALRSGVDVHALNAAAIYGCKPEEARTHLVMFQGSLRPARWCTKRGTHGWDYGLMDRKAGKMFRPCEKWLLGDVKDYLHGWSDRTGDVDGVSIASWVRRMRAATKAPDPDVEMRKFVRRMYDHANTLKAREWRIAYFARWPRLAEYQATVIERVEKTRELTNPLGRYLKFYGFRWDFREARWVFDEREEALAFLPASTARDINKALLPTMAHITRQYGGRILTTTYDSYSACIPKEKVSEYVRDATAAMEETWPELGEVEGFGYFWCPAETKVGENWGPHHCHSCNLAGCQSCERGEGCEWVNPGGLTELQ